MERKYKSLAMPVAGLTKGHYRVVTLLTCLLVMVFVDSERAGAQPTVVDPRLEVRTVVPGLALSVRPATGESFLAEVMGQFRCVVICGNGSCIFLARA